MKLTEKLKDLLRPKYVWKLRSLYCGNKLLLVLGADIFDLPDATINQFKKFVIGALTEKWKKEAEAQDE